MAWKRTLNGWGANNPHAANTDIDIGFYAPLIGVASLKALQWDDLSSQDPPQAEHRPFKDPILAILGVVSY